MTLKITAGASEVLISAVDADLAAESWFINSQGYVINGGNGRNHLQRLHRLILARKLGRRLRKGEDVDHANGDKLDNRRENLRLATRSENNHNRHRGRNNSTGYKGVYLNTYKDGPRPYQASIMRGHRKVYLGSFATPQEAARAYDQAARELYGEFAKGNFR